MDPPARFYSMSTCRSGPRAASMAERTCVSSVTSVGTKMLPGRPRGRRPRSQAQGGVDLGYHHPGAVGSEPSACRPADAGPPTGDEGDLVLHASHEQLFVRPTCTSWPCVRPCVSRGSSPRDAPPCPRARTRAWISRRSGADRRVARVRRRLRGAPRACAAATRTAANCRWRRRARRARRRPRSAPAAPPRCHR